MKSIVTVLLLVSISVNASVIDDITDGSLVTYHETVTVNQLDWDSAVNNLIVNCEFIEQDSVMDSVTPFIYQCKDWAVHTDKLVEDSPTTISIEGIDYIKE